MSQDRCPENCQCNFCNAGRSMDRKLKQKMMTEQEIKEAICNVTCLDPKGIYGGCNDEKNNFCTHPDLDKIVKALAGHIPCPPDKEKECPHCKGAGEFTFKRIIDRNAGKTCNGTGSVDKGKEVSEQYKQYRKAIDKIREQAEELAKTKEQLRLCNIDQINAEQELAKMRSVLQEIKDNRCGFCSNNYLAREALK